MQMPKMLYRAGNEEPRYQVSWMLTIVGFCQHMSTERVDSDLYIGLSIQSINEGFLYRVYSQIYRILFGKLPLQSLRPLGTNVSKGYGWYLFWF